MKTPNIVLWVGLILLTFFSGCAQSTANAITSSSETSLLPTISATSTPSVTPLPTITPIPKRTPMVIPTLPTEKAQVELLKMLSAMVVASCLACGDLSGKSTFQEAQDILLPLYSVSVFTGFRSGVAPCSQFITMAI